MAIANAHIVADVIEVNEFPDLIQRYAVQGVPKTVINETVEFVGNVPLHTDDNMAVEYLSGRSLSKWCLEEIANPTLHKFVVPL